MITLQSAVFITVLRPTEMRRAVCGVFPPAGAYMGVPDSSSYTRGRGASLPLTYTIQEDGMSLFPLLVLTCCLGTPIIYILVYPPPRHMAPRDTTQPSP